jgi:hypothetical protein
VLPDNQSDTQNPNAYKAMYVTDITPADDSHVYLFAQGNVPPPAPTPPGC